MVGGGIGEVLESKSPKFKKGDFVVGQHVPGTGTFQTNY
jgi:NADPH-dependent curcumin reductase CurA